MILLKYENVDNERNLNGYDLYLDGDKFVYIYKDSIHDKKPGAPQNAIWSINTLSEVFTNHAAAEIFRRRINDMIYWKKYTQECVK
jgi:hypothetical protein